MNTAPIPKNETKRLEALLSYNLLNTLPEDSYDTITGLCAHICDTPIALVTLLSTNRNFFKSHHGLGMSESSRDVAFCGHAILTTEPVFIVEDTRVDDRFKNNPLIKKFDAIFYAGVPLYSSDGYALGTLCVYDHKPRTLSDTQKDLLQGLAKQVVYLFEARKMNIELLKAKDEIAKRSERLEDFAKLVAHDLKSPLASIEGLLHLINMDYPAKDDSRLAGYVEHIKTSSQSMRNYIDGLLSYYRSETLLDSRDQFHLSDIITRLRDIYKSENLSLNMQEDLLFEDISKIGLQQIIFNLVDNAIKYNDKEKLVITVDAIKSDNLYTVSITDNGVGISKDNHKLIFELFKTTGTKDKYGVIGTGLGLATVQKLVEGLGGSITVKSTLGVGSIFTFTIKR